MRYLAVLIVLTVAACSDHSIDPMQPNYSQAQCFAAFSNGFPASNRALEASGKCPKNS